MPVIFYRQNGKQRYDTHGTFDSMVSTKPKRRACEYDFLSCFMANKDTEAGFEPDSVRLVWVQTKVELLDLTPPVGVVVHESKGVLSTATARSVGLVE